MRRMFIAWLFFALMGSAPTLAVQPDEILPDPNLEARARALSAGLRCLVCQNQSIDDSDAPLARDLRVLIRERLLAGDDDRAVRSFIVERYGEFVLLKPPLAMKTIALWAGPFVILIIALLFLLSRRRTQTDDAEAPLSDDEKTAFGRLLKGD
jgi:cytochrome c-type biogenesis protein CcmH